MLYVYYYVSGIVEIVLVSDLFKFGDDVTVTAYTPGDAV